MHGRTKGESGVELTKRKIHMRGKRVHGISLSTTGRKERDLCLGNPFVSYQEVLGQPLEFWSTDSRWYTTDEIVSSREYSRQKSIEN